MKSFQKYLLISIVIFSLGLIAASTLFFSKSQTLKPKQIQSDKVAEIANQSESEEDDKFSLEKIWIEEDVFNYQGYQIQRNCNKEEKILTECKLEIHNKNKLLASFESSIYLNYGFFSFIGTQEKQLVIETYSGGAHCCETYYIYDLKHDFRSLFNGENFDFEQIGGILTPVDIDNDGVYELRLSVMTFDYQLTSHAYSPFPPAVFAYDKKQGQYILANKKYSEFVLSELNKVFEWAETNSQSQNDWVIAVNKVLYFTYAGKEKEGWKFFEEIYKGDDKKELRARIKKVLSKDITYKSIYGEQPKILLPK